MKTIKIIACGLVFVMALAEFSDSANASTFEQAVQSVAQYMSTRSAEIYNVPFYPSRDQLILFLSQIKVEGSTAPDGVVQRPRWIKKSTDTLGIACKDRKATLNDLKTCDEKVIMVNSSFFNRGRLDQGQCGGDHRMEKKIALLILDAFFSQSNRFDLTQVKEVTVAKLTSLQASKNSGEVSPLGSCSVIPSEILK